MRVLPAACCIRSDDETLVRELAAHHALRTLGLRAVAPTVLVLSLIQRYAPALESDTGATTVERPPTHRTKAPVPARDPGAPLALAQRLLERAGRPTVRTG